MTTPPTLLTVEAGSTAVLIGGGRLMRTFVSEARRTGVVVSVLTNERQLAEDVGGETLRAALLRNGVTPLVLCSLSIADVEPLVARAAIGVSLSAPWIIRQGVIDLFAGRLFNVHGTALPEDRGGGGMTWNILRGHRRGGLTLHVLAPEVDVGDVVHQVRFEYPAACHTPADLLAHRMAHEDAFVASIVASVRDGGTYTLIPQDESRATYWPRLSTAVNGFIDWSWTASEIVEFVYAFGAPHVGAGTFLRDAEVRLSDCEVGTKDGAFHPYQAGLVYRIHDGAAYIAARGGAVVARTIDGADGADALAALRPGDRLHTPSAVLERARSARAVVTSDGVDVRE